MTAAVQHRPIGHAPLSADALKGLTMTKPVVERGVRDSDYRRIEALAALQPAADEDAGLQGPIEYSIDRAAQAEIALCVEGLEEAAENAKRDDAALAQAMHTARMRPHHESRSGLLAARSMTTRAKADKDALAANAEALCQCDDADRAIPALKELAAESRRLQDLAFGPLRGTVAKALDALRLKAARRYTEMAAEQTRALALINATVALQPRSQEELASAMNVFHLHLSVPSLPDPLHCQRINGRESMHFKSLLLAVNHSRLMANTVAVKSVVIVELRELLAPLGLDVGNVTI